MRIFKILLVTGLMISYPVLSKDYTVASPDNRVILTVQVGDEVMVGISYDGKKVVTDLTPALFIGLAELPGPKPGQPKSILVSVTDTLRPVVPHKNKIIADNYRVLSLRFKNGCTLVFRVYNDGVAYRFTTSIRGDITVTEERFGFSLPEGATSWYPIEKGFMSHNEQKFILSSLDTVGPEHLALRPALCDERREAPPYRETQADRVVDQR